MLLWKENHLLRDEGRIRYLQAVAASASERTPRGLAVARAAIRRRGVKRILKVRMFVRANKDVQYES